MYLRHSLIHLEDMSTFTVIIQDHSAAQATAASSQQDKPATTPLKRPVFHEAAKAIGGFGQQSTVGNTNNPHATLATSDQQPMSKPVDWASTPQKYTAWDLLNCR